MHQRLLIRGIERDALDHPGAIDCVEDSRDGVRWERAVHARIEVVDAGADCGAEVPGVDYVLDFGGDVRGFVRGDVHGAVPEEERVGGGEDDVALAVLVAGEEEDFGGWHG